MTMALYALLVISTILGWLTLVVWNIRLHRQLTRVAAPMAMPRRSLNMSDPCAPDHLRPGQVLVVTEGIHDEYRLVGVVRVVREGWLSDLFQRFVEESDLESFLTWLVDEGYVEPVTHRRLHLGDDEWSEPSLEPRAEDQARER